MPIRILSRILASALRLGTPAAYSTHHFYSIFTQATYKSQGGNPHD